MTLAAFNAVSAVAAWRHVGARDGFEVASLERVADGWSVKGMTAAVERSDAWAVRYDIAVSERWVTRSAQVVSVSAAGERRVMLTHDGGAGWLVDDVARPDLDGCLDVDLESSAMTNTFPVHRLGPHIGQRQSAPAVYVGAGALDVRRLEQHYTRLDEAHRFHYEAPGFDFTADLCYDANGLVLDYPGVARRAH